MPKREGVAYCLNHPNRAMDPNPRKVALVAETADGSDLDLAGGVSLQLFACTVCGYVELYLPDTSPFPRVRNTP